jgi:prepilin-type N-terminal cleavage/methylation domain-containing protein
MGRSKPDAAAGRPGRVGFLPVDVSPSGFTLTEMMVVILLVGILAVVAVPVYDRYIRQTKASEARAMIGAIAVAEKAYAERNNAFVAVAKNDVAAFQDKLKVDVKESGLFDYQVDGVNGRTSFRITASVNSNGVKEGLPSGGTVVLTYDRNREPREQWQENL